MGWLVCVRLFGLCHSDSDRHSDRHRGRTILAGPVRVASMLQQQLESLSSLAGCSEIKRVFAFGLFGTIPCT